MPRLLLESDVSDGLKEVEVEDVYVLIDGIGEDEDKTIQFKITDEGLILDLIDSDGEIIGTNSLHINDLEEMLV
jgi:hypothetical protein